MARIAGDRCFDYMTLSILIGVGNGTFRTQMILSAGNGPISVVTSNFNGDSDSVLALTMTNHGDNSMSVLLGFGNGTFGSQTTTSVGRGPYIFVANDFNADRFVNLAVPNGFDNTISVLNGVCNESFGASTTFPTGNNPFMIAIIDFNSGGRLDIVVTNYMSSTVLVFLDFGNGTYELQTTSLVGNNSLVPANSSSFDIRHNNGRI